MLHTNDSVHRCLANCFPNALSLRATRCTAAVKTRLYHFKRWAQTRLSLASQSYWVWVPGPHKIHRQKQARGKTCTEKEHSLETFEVSVQLHDLHFASMLGRKLLGLAEKTNTSSFTAKRTLCVVSNRRQRADNMSMNMEELQNRSNLTLGFLFHLSQSIHRSKQFFL